MHSSFNYQQEKNSQNNLLTQQNFQNIQENDAIHIWFDNGYINLDSEQKKFFYLIEAPSIKNIVFSGGGTRGILYTGVINAFEDFYGSSCDNQKNFISQIETIAGASIGSVFASTLAAGIKSNEVNETVGLQNLQELLGTGFGPIKKNADPLYNLLKRTIPQIIIKRLNEIIFASNKNDSIENFLIEQLSFFDDQNKQVLLNLCEELKNSSATITFAMLKILHKLFPETFKDLYISVVCKENGEACYFSYESTPNLEIALACRASVAVPIIIEAVKIPKKMIKTYCNNKALPELLNFVDGGYLDNIPFMAVEEKQKKEYGINEGEDKQNLQTLIILFDDSVAVNAYENIENPQQNLNNSKTKKNYPQSPFLNVRSFSKHELAPPNSLDFLYNIVPKTIGGINSPINYTLQREKNYERVRHLYAQRNIPLAPGFTSSDFEKANRYALTEISNSKNLTMEYLFKHNNECVYQCYHSFHEFLVHTPENIFNLLMENKDKVSYLENISITEITNSRVKIKNSFKCMYSAFEQLYKLVHINYNYNLMQFSPVLNNFEIIKNDKHANKDEKIIRALSVVLDYYPMFNTYEEYRPMLHIFNKKFKKYIQDLKLDNDINIDFDAEDFCLDNNARKIFYKSHLFYTKFQRIILLLEETHSTFINPDDPFNRSFLETIKNDLNDIASFHLNEQEKLIRMENYLYENYYKLLFYQKSSSGTLAKTLKKIIEHPAGLRLNYKYGIHLPQKVDRLPAFILNNNQINSAILQKKYQIKKDMFKRKIIKSFSSSTNPLFNNFNKIVDNILLLPLNEPLIDSVDEIKLQSIVVTLLRSSNKTDREFAEELCQFIVPADLDKCKKNYPTLFYAVALFTQLCCLYNKSKKNLYEQLIKELKELINKYHEESTSQHQLSELIKKYYFHLKESATCYLFFNQPDKLLNILIHQANILRIPLNASYTNYDEIDQKTSLTPYKCSENLSNQFSR